jgi:hypothetical protein
VDCGIRGVNVVIVLLLRKIKVKQIPLQALSGPEGSRRLVLPDFKTIGTCSGKVVSATLSQEIFLILIYVRGRKDYVNEKFQ